MNACTAKHILSYTLIGLLSLLLGACGSTAANLQARAERQAQAREAQALFQERCKTAGEKIYRTAENVEGVMLMKLRPERDNYDDQFKLDDPYGRDSSGEMYLKTFFLDTYLDANQYATSEKREEIRKKYLGYRYVEAIDPKDGKRYRYTGRIEEPWQTDKHYLKGYTRFVLDKTPAAEPSPRYGVTYEDISTRADREHWIAGSSLRVIDLQTNEVMAERIGYMWDPGQGNDGGGRSPWLLAASYACPSFGSKNPVVHGVPGAAMQADQTRKFVTKVLIPVE